MRKIKIHARNTARRDWPTFEIRDHELLLVHRRRLGITQRKAAEDVGVTQREYSHIERGEHPMPDWAHRWVRNAVDYLEPHELCVLYRHQAGKLQREVATEMGISRVRLNQIERGYAPRAVDHLIWHWEQ